MITKSSRGNFSIKIKKYIKYILKVMKEEIKEMPKSIILFGSILKENSFSNNSDIDIILIMDDSISNQKMKKAIQSLYFIEKKFFNFRNKDKFIEKILFYLGNSTGMFKSFFICRERDLISLNFDHIFGVNKFFSYLFAPKNIVLSSVLTNSKIIHGKEYYPKINLLNINFNEVIKSLLMCSSLAIGSLFLSPFSNEALLYIYESVKWAFLNVYFYLNKNKTNFNETLYFFKKILGQNCLLKLVNSYRKGGQFPKGKILNLLNLILQIHLISPKKYLKEVK